MRYDTVRYDTIRYNTIQYDAVQHDMVQYDMISFIVPSGNFQAHSRSVKSSERQNIFLKKIGH